MGKKNDNKESLLNRQFDAAVKKECGKEVRDSFRQSIKNGLRYERILNRDADEHPVNIWLRIITWCVRLVAGGVFTFSGIAKCIDPWGTLYKMQDYVGAAGMSFSDDLLVSGAFGLSILEFMTGVFIIFGCFRRFTPWLLSAIMLFMLPLSLWIATSNPVEDCGCFGDAYIISNWATFWKNIGLSICAVWLLFFNRKTGWIIRPYLQWLAVVITGVYAALICFAGYSYQPLIDFRNYKIGEKIYDGDAVVSADPQLVFIYEKDGKKEEFTEDSLPDESEGWVFVDRKEVGAPSTSADESGLALWPEEGDDDLTSEVLGVGGRQILLLMPELRDVSISGSYTINSMNKWATSQNIDFSAIVAGTSDEISEWKDLSIPEYPIYRAEDTVIKEIARGNPAVVYLEDGVIKWKRTLRSIDVEGFMDDNVSNDAMIYSLDNERLFSNVSLIYLSCMAVLVLFSFIPLLVRLLKR